MKFSSSEIRNEFEVEADYGTAASSPTRKAEADRGREVVELEAQVYALEALCSLSRRKFPPGRIVGRRKDLKSHIEGSLGAEPRQRQLKRFAGLYKFSLKWDTGGAPVHRMRKFGRLAWAKKGPRLAKVTVEVRGLPHFTSTVRNPDLRATPAPRPFTVLVVLWHVLSQ